MTHHTALTRRKLDGVRAVARAVPGRARLERPGSAKLASIHTGDGDTEDEAAYAPTPEALSSRLTRLRVLVWWRLVRFDADQPPMPIGSAPLQQLIREASEEGLDRSEPQACNWDEALARYISSLGDGPTRGQGGRGRGVRRRVRLDLAMPAKPELTAGVLLAIEQDIRSLEQLAESDDAEGCHHR